MKRLLIILFLFPLMISAQTNITGKIKTNFIGFAKSGYLSSSYHIERIIDTIYNKGSENCIHEWVSKDVNNSPYNKNMSCFVSHDSRGCPDTWAVKERICRNCLRYIRVHENRVLDEVIKQESEFDKLKKRIK